jgi:Protein of unknown function (DUF1559)
LENHGKLDSSNNLTQITVVNNPNLYENWVVKILPQMENKSLLVTMDLTKPISGTSTFKGNMDARKVPLPLMLCPSDPYNSQPFMG